MNNPGDIGNTAEDLFAQEQVQDVLSDSFYTASPESAVIPRSEEKIQAKEKPTHYKVICISMYTDALGKLDDMVKELKSRGYTKANRSALIRHALTCVDLDTVPRGL